MSAEEIAREAADYGTKLMEVARETGFQEWMEQATKWRPNVDPATRWIREMPIIGMKLGWGAGYLAALAAKDAEPKIQGNETPPTREPTSQETGDEWGCVFHDQKQVWQIIAADGRVIIDGIGEFRYEDMKSRREAAKLLAEQIRDNFNMEMARARSLSPDPPRPSGISVEAKPESSELRQLRAREQQLTAALKSRERVHEVCNDLFREAVAPVLHLWPESERPPGVQMICLKLQELHSREQQMREDVERLTIRNEIFEAAYNRAYKGTYQSHTGHWDKTGKGGAGCPECRRATEAREDCQKIISDGLKRLEQRAALALPAAQQPERATRSGICPKCDEGMNNAGLDTEGDSAEVHRCAAQQQPAPAAEQEDWERKHQELSAVHAVFTTAIRKAIGMECPCPLSDIVDNVIALSEEHRKAWQKANTAAPPPAQEKPVEASVEEIARKTAESIADWIAGDPPMKEWEIRDIAAAVARAINQHAERFSA
jgi:hypothetical protein